MTRLFHGILGKGETGYRRISTDDQLRGENSMGLASHETVKMK